MASIVSMKTAMRIYNAHREIETAEKLLKEIELELSRLHGREKDLPVLKDTWGRDQYLQLGVPRSDDSRTLYRVPNSLAKYCIEAHIAQQRKELHDASIAARMELDGVGADIEQPEAVE